MSLPERRPFKTIAGAIISAVYVVAFLTTALGANHSYRSRTSRRRSGGRRSHRRFDREGIEVLRYRSR